MESFNPIISKNKSNPDILLLGNLHPEIQLSAINQLNNKPSAIILDTMNYWIENFWDTVKEVISKVDIISINDEESEMITGHQDLKKAAEVLHKMGPRYVIIKKGKDGAELFNYEKRYVANAYEVDKVIDPTGAGDSYAGGLFSSLDINKNINRKSIIESMVYASALSSFTIESFGIERLLNLKKKDIVKREKELRKIARV